MKFKWIDMLSTFFEKHYIKICFTLGWIAVLASLWGDLIFPNTYEWFPRAGAILCMLSITAEFRLSRMERIYTGSDLSEALKYNEAMSTGVFPETEHEKTVKMFTHISVASGTLIWAYGDLILTIKT